MSQNKDTDDMYRTMIHACPYFKHPYIHESAGHAHLCNHEDNPTFRCGYDKDEWRNCPLSDKEVKEWQVRDDGNKSMVKSPSK